jgi:hypothetical protein
MLIKELNKLFVYVPLGYGEQFINNYAQLDDYKQKIAFVAEKHQIWTNGESFGISSTDFDNLLQLVRDNHEELDARITVLENSQAGEIARALEDHENRLDVLEGDENTEGSIKNAIKALQDLILGDESHLQETLDTIAEIDQWISDRGQEYVDLVNDVSTNTQAIADEKARAEQAESDLDARVTAIEDITIWDTFEPDEDSIPMGANSIIMNDTADLDGITDTTNTDVVVNSQDAMGYFTDDANGSKTFNNIKI